MYLKKSIYLISVLFTLVIQQGLAQNYTILKDTVVNRYTSIQSIICLDKNDVDSVMVEDLTGFNVDDTVMIYCVKGSEIVTKTSLGFPDSALIGGDATNPRNTGRYSYFIINEIDEPGKVVVLNNTVRDHIRTMRDGEVAQLIRVPSYRYVDVDGLTAEPWDPLKGHGGVVTLFANVVRLSGDINASGLGFNGASENHDYLFGCSYLNPTGLDSLFYHIDDYWAGLKGEGITDIRFDSLRGRAKNINGGGGGNGLFSGGGGGSNFSEGGDGGFESSACDPGVVDPGGQGGYDLSAVYYLNADETPTFNRHDRVFFGGGGGTGTRTVTIPTDGGNGGGLVVIVADSIIGNGKWIRAQGSSAEDSEGAAGGGGGGGSIILDVNGYRTPLKLSAKGGDGGNTTGPVSTGPGGGGGGGVYWIAGGEGEHPELDPIPDKGFAGKYQGNQPYGASDGQPSEEKYELIVPILGFIFNPVPTEFKVCSDQVPEPIYAAEPKGGGGPGTYDYIWVDSSSTQPSWLPAAGTNDKQSYEFQNGDGTYFKLDDTTYYRRVVIDKNGILPNDTSFRIAVYVQPEILNNTISAPDTVCYGEAAKLFIPAADIGGGIGNYTYLWHKEEIEGAGLQPADGANRDSTYQTPGLITSTHFTRIAKSGVCIDTSESVFVQVWDSLTNYQITDNDTVCYNLREPDLLESAGSIGGGDPDDKRYQWMASTDKTGWSDIPGATSESYQPPVQTQTHYYSRIVFSGSENACMDTSDFVEILNINLIDNNTIADTRTVCTGDDGGELTGSVPSGGVDGLQFSFTWQSRTKSTGWINVDSSFENRAYSPGRMDGDTTWYRRAIGAGRVARNECVSFSNVDTIHVLPPITNNLIATVEELKCQDDLLDWLTQDPTLGPEPIGGDASWIYQWQVSSGTDAPGSWEDIAGATAIDYTDRPALEGDLDRWYRRRVYSGPNDVCQDFSDTIHITVHTGISGNTIDPVDSACFNSFKELQGALPLGEQGLIPEYTWREAISGAELPGEQGQNYTYNFDIQQLYQFERETKIGACTDTSNTMRIAVMELPGGMLSGDISRSCEMEVMLEVGLSTQGLENYILPWNAYLTDGVNHGDTIGPYPLNGDGEVAVELDTDSDSTQFNYTLAKISYTSQTERYECIALPENLSGSVPIKVFRTPQPQITVDGAARNSFKVCNTTISLEADPDRGEGVWAFNPSNFISASPTSENGYLISIPNSPEAYGTYGAKFTSTAGVCSGIDSIDLYYFEQPKRPDVGGDTILFLINEVELKTDPPSAGTGTWTVDPAGPTIEEINSPTTKAYNLELGVENTFTWTVRNGEDEGECIDSSDFKVVVRTEVKRYQGFSPNGDMENEYYIMQGMVYADKFSVTFFNSLGNTVRTITEENIDQVEYDPNLIKNGLREDELVVWDGRSENGSLVPSGTYYYVVNYIKYQRDPDSGNITRTDTYEYKDYVVVLRD